MDVKNPTITDIESPSVETTKGISTSTSGDSISVSECNGHVSPVKEEQTDSSQTATNNERVCDDNSMDQGVEDIDEEGKADQVVGVESLGAEEKGHGDASTTNTSMCKLVLLIEDLTLARTGSATAKSFSKFVSLILL